MDRQASSNDLPLSAILRTLLALPQVLTQLAHPASVLLSMGLKLSALADDKTSSEMLSAEGANNSAQPGDNPRCMDLRLRPAGKPGRRDSTAGCGWQARMTGDIPMQPSVRGQGIRLAGQLPCRFWSGRSLVNSQRGPHEASMTLDTLVAESPPCCPHSGCQWDTTVVLTVSRAIAAWLILTSLDTH